MVCAGLSPQRGHLGAARCPSQQGQGGMGWLASRGWLSTWGMTKPLLLKQELPIHPHTRIQKHSPPQAGAILQRHPAVTRRAGGAERAPAFIQQTHGHLPTPRLPGPKCQPWSGIKNPTGNPPPCCWSWQRSGDADGSARTRWHRWAVPGPQAGTHAAAWATLPARRGSAQQHVVLM